MKNAIRPQVLTAIVALWVITIVSLFLGLEQVALATGPGIGMLAMRIIEKED